MAVVAVLCSHCGSKEVVKNGKSRAGAQRYACRGSNCSRTFQLAHRYKAYDRGMKERIVDMALNGSGIRDTSRVRTRIKRLARKTICFSKSEWMHDIVIGLFINRFEFKRNV